MPLIEKTIAEFVHWGDLPSVGPEDNVATAVEVMKSRRSDCVIVLEDKKLAGIFTERDFLNRVSAVQISPAETPLRQVMTADPDTLSPGDCISYAINRMAHGGFRNIPIVDEKGSALAVLTVRDVVAHLSDVFAEVEGGQAERASDWKDWTDIGGG